MKTIKSFGSFVLAFAITVGTIAKFRRDLFLRIPKFGYIPWVLTGGDMPPLLMPAVWSDENAKQFLADGDVVLASGVKAGTIWVATIMNLLRSKGDDSYSSLVDEFGSVEMREHPAQTPAESIKKHLENKMNNPSLRPWFWFGHGTPKAGAGLNPRKNPGVKYVMIVRNGKEVIRSFYPFCNSLNPEFRSMWGGFPPTLASPRETFKVFTTDVPQFFFEYTREWWEFRNDKNVIMLHFADLKKDLKGSVRKLAKFLEMEASEDVMKTVIEKADFKYMKKYHQDKTRHCFARWPGTNRTICEIDESKTHFNKGETGGTDNFFDQQMSDEWTGLVEKHFGKNPGLADWAENGGDFN